MGCKFLVPPPLIGAVVAVKRIKLSCNAQQRGVSGFAVGSDEFGEPVGRSGRHVLLPNDRQLPSRRIMGASR